MIREMIEEERKRQPVKREREILRQRLGETEKYFLSYLGGGDFLVHVIGIDTDVDRIYLETCCQEEDEE